MLRLAVCCNAKNLLTAPAILRDKRGGPRFPNEALLICKDGRNNDDDETGRQARAPLLFIRPLRQAPRMVRSKSWD